MKLRSFALTAAAACSLGLTACGGDDTNTSGSGGGAEDANALLVSTFQPGEEGKIKSGKLELKISGKLSGSVEGGGEASATVLLNEAKDGEIPEFQADIAVKGEQKAQKLDVKAGGTYTDGRFYVSYDGDNYDVGEELSKRATESIKRSLEQAEQAGGKKNQALVGQLGLEPQTWLKDPKVEGEESIGGTDTYKITGAVDVKAMVPDILDAAKKAQSLAGGASKQQVPEVTDEDLAKAEEQIKQLDVAIWTGKDDSILRKIEVETEIEGDKKGDKIEGSLSLTLTGVNEQQDIEAPSETKPITDLMPKLGGLFGAASGITGSGSGAASGGANTPEAAVSREYLECVNAAAGDAGKLNACQSKLNP